MAAHVCTQLRTALVTLLTGLATTGARAYADRPDERELQGVEVPALILFTDGEEVEQLLDGVTLQRQQRMRVAIRVKYTGAIDDTLDQIRKEVETALANGVTVAGRIIRPAYFGMSDPVLDDSTDQTVMAAELLLSFLLNTALGAPDVLI